MKVGCTLGTLYGANHLLCRTKRDKVEDDFMLAYPDINLWSNTHQIQVATFAAGATWIEGTATNECVTTYKLVDQTIVTNKNLQKQLLLEYKRNSKIKSQEYSKSLQDKKSLCTILYGQCDEATQPEISLEDNYTEDSYERRLLAFIEQLRAIWFGSDDGGLIFAPYKQVVTIKSLNTYTNNEVHDPNSFKEQVMIKYEATTAIVGRFPNWTAALTHLLSNAEPNALDWDGFVPYQPRDDLCGKQEPIY